MICNMAMETVDQIHPISFEVYPGGYGGTSSLLQNQILFATLFCVSFTIAGVFAWLGMWMILPFAGLEMLVLAVALYICRRNLMYREVITINKQNISILAGHEEIENECTLKRAWAKVLMLPTSSKHTQSLWIRSHGRQVEIGKCLSSDDKQALACVLSQSIRK